MGKLNHWQAVELVHISDKLMLLPDVGLLQVLQTAATELQRRERLRELDERTAELDDADDQRRLTADGKAALSKPWTGPCAFSITAFDKPERTAATEGGATGEAPTPPRFSYPADGCDGQAVS